ncbi:MAG: serine/threonine protein kinase, partial [Deltaproteobacteria bacterium]|nr:serine/threonine protein kinase [Deltaproteobacteria bacterium]
MDLIGKTIAQHRILANLGDGGMGKVYLAEHEAIKRRVAIKVLHRRLSHDKETVERFLNEARAANRVRHSGIVDIHDAGIDEELGAYLVMEYLDGETLAARVTREGLLPVAEVGRIVDAVASVLEAAHKAGIVHRDLKPANIFILPDDQSG